MKTNELTERRDIMERSFRLFKALPSASNWRVLEASMMAYQNECYERRANVLMAEVKS